MCTAPRCRGCGRFCLRGWERQCRACIADQIALAGAVREMLESAGLERDPVRRVMDRAERELTVQFALMEAERKERN